MKPQIVADEMFPEGAGPFMELEEVILYDDNQSIVQVNFNHCFNHLFLDRCTKGRWIKWFVDGFSRK